MIDAPRPDGPPKDGPASGGHLLITEIGSRDAEFIEIYNPTAATVSLANYYLGDVTTYWRLPSAIPTSPASDFIVKFPPAAQLQAGGVLVVALDAIAFQNAYGRAPELGVLNQGTAPAVMEPIVVGGSPSISDDAETVVLFHWDGRTDLVQDVDIVATGEGQETINDLVPKQAIDGPDVGPELSSYAADTFALGEMMNDAGSGQTYKRKALESGFEVQGGTGNGITGDDETSENMAMTWDGVLTAATPGTIPPALQ